MVAEAYVAVNASQAVRQWCRDQGFVAFFGTKNNGTFPQVVIQRVAGTDDDALYQFDVWAQDGAGAKQAEDEAARLATALNALSGYSHSGVRLHGARWEGTRWIPDPATDRPRFIVEATVFSTAL